MLKIAVLLNSFEETDTSQHLLMNEKFKKAAFIQNLYKITNVFTFNQ